MEDRDIDFYLKLRGSLKYTPVASGAAIVLLIANSFINVIKALDPATSLFAGIVLIPWFIETIYRETIHKRCLAIITKLVNRDPELLQQVIKRQNH